MKPVTLDLQVRVDVAPEAVFAAVTDWERQSDWMVGTQVHVTAGDGRGVGSRLVAVTGVGGVGFLDPMVITRWEPPHHCEVRHVGKLVRGTGLIHVLPGPGEEHCVLRWVERLDVPFGGVGKLGWMMIRPAFTWGLRQSLDRFCRYCTDNVVRENG